MSNLFLTNLYGSDNATMNSLDIEVVTGSKHDKVKQSIQRLAAKGFIALPPMGIVVNKVNNRDYKTEVYVFSGDKGKRDIERGQSRKPKLIYGCGFNSKGKHRAAKGGKNTLAYRTWNAMIQRCYCPKFHEKNTTYVDCSVIDDWLDYQNFAEWFYSHSYSEKGYQLDKDLLFPSNRVYSPETCCFVPQQLNSLLTSSKAARGGYPQGVNFHKSTGNYRAQIRIDNKNHHLGYFDCPNQAHQAYKAAKERNVKSMAVKWANRIEWDVFVALMNWRLVEGG